MPADTEQAHSAVRTVLLEDWDPTNAARSEYARNAYDAYIPPLLDLVRSGATEAQLIDFLYEREREIMCFPGLGRERLRRVARRLLAVVPT